MPVDNENSRMKPAIFKPPIIACISDEPATPPPIPPRRRKHKSPSLTNAGSVGAKETSPASVGLRPRRDWKPRLPPPLPPTRVSRQPPASDLRLRSFTGEASFAATTTNSKVCQKMRIIVDDEEKKTRFFEEFPLPVEVITREGEGMKQSWKRDHEEPKLTESQTNNSFEAFKSFERKKPKPNKYPPLFFTSQDFQSVMAESSTMSLGGEEVGRRSITLKEEEHVMTFSSNRSTNEEINRNDDENEEVYFRVTTTNVPFEKCLEKWNGSLENESFHANDHFVFDNYINRSKRSRIVEKSSSGLFRDDTFEDSVASSHNRSATKVRFVVRSPSSSASDPGEEGVACSESMQNFESLPVDLIDTVAAEETTSNTTEVVPPGIDEFGEVPFRSLLNSEKIETNCDVRENVRMNEVDRTKINVHHEESDHPSDDFSESPENSFQTFVVKACVESVPSGSGENDEEQAEVTACVKPCEDKVNESINNINLMDVDVPSNRTLGEIASDLHNDECGERGNNWSTSYGEKDDGSVMNVDAMWSDGSSAGMRKGDRIDGYAEFAVTQRIPEGEAVVEGDLDTATETVNVTRDKSCGGVTQKRQIFIDQSLWDLLNDDDDEDMKWSASMDDEKFTDDDNMIERDDQKKYSAGKGEILEGIKVDNSDTNNGGVITCDNSDRLAYLTKSLEDVDRKNIISSGKRVVPIEMRRNFFLEHMLKEDLQLQCTWQEGPCQVIAAHLKTPQKNSTLKKPVMEKPEEVRIECNSIIDSSSKISERGSTGPNTDIIKVNDPQYQKIERPKQLEMSTDRGIALHPIENNFKPDLSNIQSNISSGAPTRIQLSQPNVGKPHMRKISPPVPDSIATFARGNKSAGEAKSDVLAELLSNFSAIKLRAITNEDNTIARCVGDVIPVTNRRDVVNPDEKSKTNQREVNQDVVVSDKREEPVAPKKPLDGAIASSEKTDERVDKRAHSGRTSGARAEREEGNPRSASTARVDVEETIISVDKCAIARNTPPTRCNNIDNNAVTPVAVSTDQSHDDIVSIVPGSVRSFIKYYEIRRETDVNSKSNDSAAIAAEEARRMTIGEGTIVGSTMKRMEDEKKKEGARESMKRMDNDVTYTVIAKNVIQQRETAEKLLQLPNGPRRRGAILESPSESVESGRSRKSVQFKSECTVISLEKDERDLDGPARVVKMRGKRKAPGTPMEGRDYEEETAESASVERRTDRSVKHSLEDEVQREKMKEGEVAVEKSGTVRLAPANASPRYDQPYVFYCKV